MDSTQHRTNLPSIAILALLVLVGFAARIFFAGEPLWVDELHTAWAVDGSFAELFSRSAQGNQTPLYFLVQWFVCSVTDLSEPALRSISIATSSIAILMAGFLVWRWTQNLVAAAVTTLLAAIDYWLLFYGSEARPYAMLQLLCLIQIHYLLEATANTTTASTRFLGKIDWRIVATTALLPLTHLTSILLIASQIAYVVLVRPNNATKIAGSILAGLFILLLAFPIIADVMANRSDWASITDPVGFVNELWPTMLPCVATPVLLIGLSRVFTTDAKKGRLASNVVNGIRSAPLTLITFCCLLPAGIALLATLAKFAPIASPRYIACSLILAPIFAGLAFEKIVNKGQPVACFLILAAAIWFNPITNNVWSNEKFVFRSENWESVVQRVGGNQIGNRSVVFLFPNLVEDPRLQSQAHDPELEKYLTFPLTGIYKLPEATITIPMPTLTNNRWQARHIQQIIQNGGAQIVARTDDSTLKIILGELAVLADEHQAKFSLITESQAGNIVQIVNVLPKE